MGAGEKGGDNPSMERSDLREIRRRNAVSDMARKERTRNPSRGSSREFALKMKGKGEC